MGKIVNARSHRVLRRLFFSLFNVQLYKVCFRKLLEDLHHSVGVVIIVWLLGGKELVKISSCTGDIDEV